MKAELKSLDITNYRNIQHANYQFDGDSKIVGENRIGKTNTLEAVVWLLTGKLLNGSTDIAAIKPLSDTKSEVRVEGTFEVDGKTIILRKEYGETWKKTRGTEDLVFDGHYLKYYYNDVLQKTERDYLALFKEDFGINKEFRGIELARMLVDPFYLGDMGETKDWTNLRAFIISLIGDVQDSDVFAANANLMPLEEDLTKSNGRIDELKKRYLNEIKGMKETIIGDDALIKHLEETKIPLQETVEVSRRAVKDLNEDIAKLQGEKASDSIIIDIDKEIVQKQSELNDLIAQEMKNSKEVVYQQKIDEQNKVYRELLSNKASLRETINSTSYDIKIYNSNIDECVRLRAEYIKRLREIDTELALPADTKCPYCGHELEGEQLEEAVAKQNKSLNDEKLVILEKGKENKRKKEYYETLIEEANAKIQKATSDLEDIETEIDSTKNKLEELTNALMEEKTFAKPHNPAVDSVNAEIERLQKKRETAIVDKRASDALVNEKLNDKYESLAAHQKVLDDYSFACRQKEESEKAKETRNEHTRKLASLEQRLELLYLFIRTKLQMLDEKVEKVFGKIKFQLIKENINGGYDPICKPYIYDVSKDESTSVSWKSGSKSERVITGIAIAEKIKQALGLADLPYLFDEGGEISTDTFNTRFKTDAQLICVKVMDNITTPMVMKI